MRYLFGDYVLDTQRAELHGAGAPIKLRRKAFQVLAYLLAHRDRVVPKHELLEHLWPDQFVGDAVLKACITALRKALGDQGRTPRFVRTLHGQGYRFVAAVEAREHLPVDAAPPALARGSSLLPEAGEGQGEGEHGQGRQQLFPVGREFPDGEHKQVTVLCGALAEAHTLAARLGPEAIPPDARPCWRWSRIRCSATAAPSPGLRRGLPGPVWGAGSAGGPCSPGGAGGL